MTDPAVLLQPFWHAIGQNNLPVAAQLVQQLLRHFPTYSDSWLAASVFAEHSGQLDKALQAIERAQTLNLHPTSAHSAVPDTAHVSLQLRQLHCLQRCGHNAAARQLADTLCLAPPKDAQLLGELALQCSQLQRFSQAAALYQQALTLQGDNATLYYNYATMLRFSGQLTEAEQMLDHAIVLAPDDTDAWHLRSSLRKQRADHNHIDGLAAKLEQTQLSPKQRVQLHYALAKELEDTAQYQASFTQLQAGATLRRKHIHYQLADDLAVMQQIQQQFDAAFFQQPRPTGYHCAEPIFIVSMPRAGSTLAERMLGCDDKVQLAGELNNFATQLSRLCQQQAGRKLDKAELVQHASQLDFSALGRAYIDSSRPHTGEKAHFVDKLPLNFLYVGLIHLALPKARIIHVQRNPIDHCYAIYKHLFADAYPFSYQLNELAQYYQAYQALMAHWQCCLPGVIHTVQYEQLISQPDAESKALYKHCGLEWTERCLQFHQHNHQASTTGSASQIRQPLYSSSVARWRSYEMQLTELVQAFPDAV